MFIPFYAYFISLQLIITRFLLLMLVFLCLYELYHDYLLVRTCFSVYQASIVKIVLYDYCGGCFLTIGDKVRFM